MRLARLSVFLIAAMLLAGDQALASAEAVLVLSSFNVHSAGIGESGPVDISGAYADAALRKLAIKAFGREFVLTPAQLKQLAGAYVNGIQLTYEDGYPEVGGRTVYIVLSTGFTSGTRSAKRITLNERGDVTIGDLVSERAAER